MNHRWAIHCASQLRELPCVANGGSKPPADINWWGLKTMMYRDHCKEDTICLPLIYAWWWLYAIRGSVVARVGCLNFTIFSAYPHNIDCVEFGIPIDPHNIQHYPPTNCPTAASPPPLPFWCMQGIVPVRHHILWLRHERNQIPRAPARSEADNGGLGSQIVLDKPQLAMFFLIQLIDADQTPWWCQFWVSSLWTYTYHGQIQKPARDDQEHNEPQGDHCMTLVPLNEQLPAHTFICSFFRSSYYTTWPMAIVYNPQWTSQSWTQIFTWNWKQIIPTSVFSSHSLFGGCFVGLWCSSSTCPVLKQVTAFKEIANTAWLHAQPPGE